MLSVPFRRGVGLPKGIYVCVLVARPCGMFVGVWVYNVIPCFGELAFHLLSF